MAYPLAQNILCCDVALTVGRAKQNSQPQIRSSNVYQSHREQIWYNLDAAVLKIKLQEVIKEFGNYQLIDMQVKRVDIIVFIANLEKLNPSCYNIVLNALRRLVTKRVNSQASCT